jgi:hypothetical protein
MMTNMSRRTYGSRLSSWIGMGLVLFISMFAGGFLLYNQMSNPFRSLESLEIASYLENSNSLRGNTYKIEGSIFNALGWSPELGRLFSVEINGGDGGIVGILIPPQFNHINIQKGQKFFFKVEVDSQGILKASDLRKA